MIDVILDNVINIEKVIKEAKKGSKEKKIQANYILGELAKQINSLGEILLNPEDILNSKIKNVEKTNSIVKGMDNLKRKKRRVVNYYMIPEIDSLSIIRQIIETEKIGLSKEENRRISILENNDLIEEGILLEDGSLNRKNPYVKRLIPKKKKAVNDK